MHLPSALLLLLSAQVTPGAYTLVELHSRNNFFDGFSLFNFADPTNVAVDYQSQEDAQSGGLIEINNDGNAVLYGIFVLDAVHIPQGCGSWPAFWSNGPNWPTTGEIDNIKGVNDYINNQATLHTASGCQIASNSTPQSLGIMSNLVGSMNCTALETGNEGCGMRSDSNMIYSLVFNSIRSGIYALVWDDDEIAVYFFSRHSMPQPEDLVAEAPLPETWGIPMARWPATNCDMNTFFRSHSIIINTTLCGDWAAGAWTTSDVPGQETSCAQRIGCSTCEDFVRNSGGSFRTAYWEISSLKVYQTT
ncbi:hypothetical protein ACEPAF_6808 [Sanghuangporus sanghuang]